MTRAHEEIIEFIAGGTTPTEVADFRPSDEARRRVAELLDREKRGGLGDGEAAELSDYLHLEHLMRLATARARQNLGRQAD